MIKMDLFDKHRQQLAETQSPLAARMRPRSLDEAIYTDESDPMVNWDADELGVAFEAAGWVVEVTTERSSTQIHITPALLERWFITTATTERLTYAQRLTRLLKEAEVRAVQDFFTRSLLHQTVTWLNTIAFVQARL